MANHSVEAKATGCAGRKCLDSQHSNLPPEPENHKVKFGVPLSESLKDDCLPLPLLDLLVYIAQEGVATTDLFRRPGNPTDAKIIMKRLTEGKEVILPSYNFYTLASVVKKFLLKIPGGVFGPDVEKKFLDVLEMDQRLQQYEEIHKIISALPQATQQLIALLFGIWFRIVNHSEFNTMSSEAVAKSVAGSLFHTCADSPDKVENAVLILQILIDDFGVANMFGRKNIQYFADMTRTGIRVKEKFRFECRHPNRRSSVASMSEDEFYGRRRSRADTKGSACSNLEVRLGSSSPPSPQSLQPQPTYHDDDNAHKKLTHCSSLSAPEVNKGYSPTNDCLSTKRMYQSSSLSRFDHVRRRQLLRMKKRSNWFLAPNQNASMESDSRLGSHDTSVGKTSLDATLSDALLPDMNISDGGMSDTRMSSDHRLSSDGGSYLDELNHRPLTPTANQTSHRSSSRLQPPDIINGNHASAGMTRHHHHNSDRLSHSTGSSPKRPVSDKDVRYFMVENWYSSSVPAAATTATTTTRHGGHS